MSTGLGFGEIVRYKNENQVSQPVWPGPLMCPLKGSQVCLLNYFLKTNMLISWLIFSLLKLHPKVKKVEKHGVKWMLSSLGTPYYYGDCAQPSKYLLVCPQNESDHTRFTAQLTRLFAVFNVDVFCLKRSFSSSLCNWGVHVGHIWSDHVWYPKQQAHS